MLGVAYWIWIVLNMTHVVRVLHVHLYKLWELCGCEHKN